MSYVAIYRINAEGDAEHLGDAKNNHGFAPIVWDKLIWQYKVPTTGSRWEDTYYDGLWSLARTGKFERLDDLLLGATFDRVWIGRDLVPDLVRSMKAFHERYIVPGNIVRTISDAAALLEVWLSEHPTDRGIAFNMCSANESFWRVYDAEAEETRPYNIDRDTGKHWEFKLP